MNKEQLLARAQELQIKVPEKATNPQIEDLIKIAEHPLLADKVKELGGLKESLEAQLTKSNELVTDLQSQIEDKAAASESAVTATYKKGKDTYAFGIAKFRFKGEKYTAEDAVKNEDLMEQIIKSKFIHLKKQ